MEIMHENSDKSFKYPKLINSYIVIRTSLFERISVDVLLLIQLENHEYSISRKQLFLKTLTVRITILNLFMHSVFIGD